MTAPIEAQHIYRGAEQALAAAQRARKKRRVNSNTSRLRQGRGTRNWTSDLPPKPARIAARCPIRGLTVSQGLEACSQNMRKSGFAAIAVSCTTEISIHMSGKRLRWVAKRGQISSEKFPKTGESLLHEHSHRTYIAEQTVGLNYSYSQR
jgi:hypothetical protein